MDPASDSHTRASSVIAGIAAIFCALVALQLFDRLGDERTLRAANEAGANGQLDRATRLAAQLTDGTTAADAWMVRAGVAVSEGRLGSAARALRRSLELRPNDWRARRDLATVLAMQGALRAAFVEFSRAGELNPGMPPLGGFGAP